MKINNNGFCKWCVSKSITYGIKDGSYTYYCNRCKKDIGRDNVLTDADLDRLYLEWFNDFLTVDQFAEYHQWTVKQALRIINRGRKINQCEHDPKTSTGMVIICPKCSDIPTI